MWDYDTPELMLCFIFVEDIYYEFEVDTLLWCYLLCSVYVDLVLFVAIGIVTNDLLCVIKCRTHSMLLQTVRLDVYLC